VCSHAGFAQADKQRSISAGQPVALTASSGNQAVDPFLPRQVAEKLFVLDNVYAKTTGLSRLASLIWKYDEDYARLLFEKALAATTPQGNGDDARLRMFQRSIISVIAKKDP
jgi:hypothetical protein